jgi:predicted Zn-ribbon and HTH transcriptional regulator
MKKIRLSKPQHCLRCDYTWIPRKEIVVRCPRCKSYHWQTVRVSPYAPPVPTT